MRKLKEVKEIYDGFLKTVKRGRVSYTEITFEDRDGNGKTELIVEGGFVVTAKYKEDDEYSAKMRCWWYTEQNSIEVESLEQLLEMYNQH